MTTSNLPTTIPVTRRNASTLNSLRNGARAYRLCVGELPARLGRLTRYARQYRESLEIVCLEAHGEVTITMAHAIDAAAGHETHCQLCRWLLREKIDAMSVQDILKCSAAMASARDARNRAVAALELERDHHQDAIDALYAPVEPENGDNQCD